MNFNLLWKNTNEYIYGSTKSFKFSKYLMNNSKEKDINYAAFERGEEYYDYENY